MNKKANIPITILVVGVLAICGLLLISLNSNKKNIENDFITIDIVEETISIKEEFYFAQSINPDSESIIFLKRDFLSTGLIDLSDDELVNKIGTELLFKLKNHIEFQINPSKKFIEAHYFEKSFFGDPEEKFRIEYWFEN